MLDQKNLLAVPIKSQQLSTITVDQGNGHGSSFTRIRRFINIRESKGSAIVYVDSPTEGASFTINETGLYSITYTDYGTTASLCGISVNTSGAATSIGALPYSSGRRTSVYNAASNAGCCSIVLFLKQGDVVRPHTDAATNATTVSDVCFTITQLPSLV